MTVANIISATAKLKLSQHALETIELLPQFFKGSLAPFENQAREAVVVQPHQVAPLDQANLPKHPKAPGVIGTGGASIVVMCTDTLEAALMFDKVGSGGGEIATVAEQCLSEDPVERAIDAEEKRVPVLVLNLASADAPGGRWHLGELGQQEELFFRTSLSYSLTKDLYPIQPHSAIYSPSVFVLRSSYKEGHEPYFDPKKDAQFPQPYDPRLASINRRDGRLEPAMFHCVSVVSIAAVPDPLLNADGTYQREDDRDMMKYKIRHVLRIAAKYGHTKLILGALGCGACKHNPQAVAKAFLEVFRESEFQGGWWERVIFAVYDVDPDLEGDTNFGHFYQTLDRRIV